MDCLEFLARFSEYYDGQVDAAFHREMASHEAACPQCQKYARTLREGTGLLRSGADLDVPPDFRARLGHRLFHVDDGAALPGDPRGSAASALSLLAVACLLTLAAWAPSLTGPPTVELPALVVAEPPPPSSTAPPGGSTFTGGLSLYPSGEFQDGIWGDAHALLFEYSSLSERRRGPDLGRTGVQ